MAVVATQLKAEITVEGAEKAKQSLKEVGKQADETKGLFDKLKDGFIKGLAFQASNLATDALGALKDQLVDVVKVAMDHQQILAQTETVLKSTASSYHGAEAAVRGHYETIGISTKMHEALQKQLDNANYSLLIATDRWDATATHSKAAADAFQHAKDRVATLEAELHKTSTVLVGGHGALAATIEITAGQVEGLADKFSQLTPYTADTIQQMENLLLTFTNIGRDVFPQTTQAVLDVSTAMHEDLQSAAIQVGKALGEPLTGMTALQRIGVTFSADEKEQIKTMMAHNDIMGAQKVILKELHTEFGGSAEAMGKTFGGQLQILQNRLEDLKVKIGTALLPILVNLEQWFIQQGLPLLQQFGQWIITQGIPDLHNLWNEFNANVLPVLQQLGMWLMQNGLPLMQQFGGIIQNDVLPVLGTLITDGTALVKWLTAGGPQTTILKDALFALGGVMASIKIIGFVNHLMDMGKQAMDFATNIGPKLVQIFTGSDGIGAAADTAGEKIKALGPAAKQAAGEVETESAAMETELSTNVGAGAAAADVEIESIGPASVAAEGMVATAAQGMLTALGPVAIAAAGIQYLMQGWSNVQDVWNKMSGGDRNPAHYSQDIANTDPTGIFGLLSNIGDFLNSHKAPTTNKFGPGVHGRASGGTVQPGEMTLVGEHGPELAMFPPGTSILPNSMLSSGASARGGSHPVYLQIDGYTFATLLMPSITQALRNNVGVYF